MDALSSSYGLFIGINRYDSVDIPPLDFASADVQAIRQRLMERFGLEHDRAMIIGDDVPDSSRPTRIQILKAMDRFAAAPMGPEDTFFLVFAGHGFACSGKTYLAAADSEIGSEALLRETAVSLNSVSDFLANTKAGQHVVVLDACRNSPAGGTRSLGDRSMSKGMTRDVGAVIQPATVTESGITGAKAILCSCWEGQVAYEFPESGHGWFCHNLIAELDAISEPTLSLADLHTSVKTRMQQDAWRLLPRARDQTPHLVIDGDIPVLGGRAENASPQPASAPVKSEFVTPPAPPPAPVHDEETEVEELLLAGRARAALAALKSRSNLSPRAEVLRCIAILMTNPMRKLRNSDANQLVRQLAELSRTAERPLANALLKGFLENYYRPLRRRPPTTLQTDISNQDLAAMDQRSRQLVELVPEIQDVLTNDVE